MTAIIIQARLKSTRLPAKIMLKLPSGRSVLEEVIYNCEQSGFKTFVVSPDAMIIKLARKHGAEAYMRIGPRNVYAEYTEAILRFNLDIVVRITADCPMLSGDIIRDVVDFYLGNDFEYVYNHNDNESGKGEGFDVEVFSSIDLIRYGEDKEHVTGNLRKCAKKLKVEFPDKEGLSINTLEDYIKVYRILS